MLLLLDYFLLWDGMIKLLKVTSCIKLGPLDFELGFKST